MPTEEVEHLLRKQVKWLLLLTQTNLHKYSIQFDVFAKILRLCSSFSRSIENVVRKLTLELSRRAQASSDRHSKICITVDEQKGDRLYFITIYSVNCKSDGIPHCLPLYFNSLYMFGISYHPSLITTRSTDKFNALNFDQLFAIDASWVTGKMPINFVSYCP